jgi:hypothetical protein
MSRLGRISKLFAAQNASQVISLLTQLLLPPIFLHNYGVTLYGEWLALSAAIGYLATVNYGIQTYTNMLRRPARSASCASLPATPSPLIRGCICNCRFGRRRSFCTC